MLTNTPPSASTDPTPGSQLAVTEALMSLLRDTKTEPRPDIQLEALTL
ncbi:AAA family ATPase, partial [Streptomyces sp. SID7982]|nr:AAA family ATPase [Streptomyces sp. SID7982]